MADLRSFVIAILQSTGHIPAFSRAWIIIDLLEVCSLILVRSPIKDRRECSILRSGIDLSTARC